jgi:glycosyltransferase involved in cell wall biosynthesis
VSIKTPVFTGARFLDCFIRSVQEEIFPSIDHIIIDDGSKDGDVTINLLISYPHLR